LPYPRLEGRARGASRPGRAGHHGEPLPARHLPGTSKWNKIEHRLFSAISMSWRGRPLTSHEVIVQTIAATTTRTGLTVKAELDTGLYPPRADRAAPQGPRRPGRRAGRPAERTAGAGPAPAAGQRPATGTRSRPPAQAD